MPCVTAAPKPSFRRYLRSSSCRSIPENHQIASEFPLHFPVKQVTLLGHSVRTRDEMKGVIAFAYLSIQLSGVYEVDGADNTRLGGGCLALNLVITFS